MIDQNKLYHSIIISLLVFVIVIILSIYFGGQKAKFDALSGFGSWKKQISNNILHVETNTVVLKKVSDVSFHADIVKTAKAQGLLYPIGKLRFTRKGYKLAIHIKANNFINYHWITLSNKITRTLGNNPKNAYDVQNASLLVALSYIDSFLIGYERQVMKKVAYHYGFAYETLFVLHALMMRDKYLHMHRIAIHDNPTYTNVRGKKKRLYLQSRRANRNRAAYLKRKAKLLRKKKAKRPWE